MLIETLSPYQDHPGSQGQRHKVVNFDDFQETLTQGLCIPRYSKHEHYTLCRSKVTGKVKTSKKNTQTDG